MTSQLHHYQGSWPLRADTCPCDIHLAEWIENNAHKGSSIFHFGTGGHHYLGIRLFENGSNNAVLGITAGKEEMDAYMNLAIERPDLSANYKVLFGDIYVLDTRLLPMFDVISLFHLGEFPEAENSEYGGMSNLVLARMLAIHLKPSGKMIFYRESMGFDRFSPDLEELESFEVLRPSEVYKSLLIYRKS